ncbi:MAG: VOC family protein [Nitrososphaerota archaeon]|nr:VOC family protein [Nitrososphaerota archaeon]
MVVKTIVHFEIPADDVEKLSKFYGEVFGWKFKNASMPGMDYWLISTGPQGKSVGGGMYKKMGPDERPRNYIGVSSVDETAETLKNAGGKIMVKKQEVPGFGWTVIAADPEGNPIALFQPVMRARRPRPKKRARRPARR